MFRLSVGKFIALIITLTAGVVCLNYTSFFKEVYCLAIDRYLDVGFASHSENANPMPLPATIIFQGNDGSRHKIEISQCSGNLSRFKENSRVKLLVYGANPVKCWIFKDFLFKLFIALSWQLFTLVLSGWAWMNTSKIEDWLDAEEVDLLD